MDLGKHRTSCQTLHRKPGPRRRDFFEKLKKQLAPAPETAIQLAAEMLWVMYLFPVSNSIKPETKRDRITQVWEWSREYFPKPMPQLGKALESGIGSTGLAFKALIWKELVFFIEIIQKWLQLSISERNSSLSDPWKFAGWLDKQEGAGSRQLRHILLYLLFPHHFEPIASIRPKQDIACYSLIVIGEDWAKVNYWNRTVLDQTLYAIREKLQAQGAPHDFDFHDEPYLKFWRPPRKDLAEWYWEKFGSTKVWALGASHPTGYWGEFLKEGIISLGWAELGNLWNYVDQEAIYEKHRELFRKKNPAMDALACHQFAREMQAGDHVLFKEHYGLI